MKVVVWNNSKSKNKSFKGCLGVKDTTNINLKENSKFAIFESFFDFLAYLTHYNITQYQNSAIILNSITLKDKVLELATKYNPSSIYLFLDNDDEGRKTTDFLLENLGDFAVFDKAGLYKGYKDFNDMVIH